MRDASFWNRTRRRRKRRLLTTALFWAITQRVVVIRYRPHLQRSRRNFWLLEMGPISRLETSVMNYNHKLRNTPEERRSHLFRRGNMKSRKKTFFTRKLDWNLGNKPVKCNIWSIALGDGANFWTLRKIDQKFLDVLKCGAGEGWTKPVGPIVWKMTKYYTESGRIRISYIQQKEGRPTGLVTSSVGTAF